MRVLVLGGYGLIGSAVTRHLIEKGYQVTGLARSARKGEALIPTAQWIGEDISKLLGAEQWHAHLDGIDIVVNAAGILQNGLSDDVAAVQKVAILALISACEQTGVTRFIQISAPGAHHGSSTLFYRTKAVADHALKTSTLEWTIIRPGLVIAPFAYGGTSLIRMLAAFPVVQPVVMASTLIQTVSVQDVANAVSLAIERNMVGADFDLVEDRPRTLVNITQEFRKWLGFPRALATVDFPAWHGSLVGRLADLAGWLGWRSALRTTSLKVLQQGVRGDPEPWSRLSQRNNLSLEQTLQALPSTRQERIYARAMLVYPVLVLTLAGFWLASGFVGMARQAEAAATLSGTLPRNIAFAFVRLGSVADILIGAALLYRPTTRMACIASILLSCAYLGGSLWFTPHLWGDPLGPMVKVFPAISLALITAALTQDR